MKFPNIEAERTRHDLSKATKFAEVMGVARGTVVNWMNGKTEIPASKLLQMSEMWNCSVDYLLGRA